MLINLVIEKQVLYDGVKDFKCNTWKTTFIMYLLQGEKASYSICLSLSGLCWAKSDIFIQGTLNNNDC